MEKTSKSDPEGKSGPEQRMEKKSRGSTQTVHTAIILTLAALQAALLDTTDRAEAGDASQRSEVVKEEVDLIEINHFHDDQGRPVFDQIIFYDWSMEDNRYQIRDWRLLKNPIQIPLRRTAENDYVAVWNDFKSRDVLRRTQTKLMRESWTQYDPEITEREFLPESKRKKLREMPPGNFRASSVTAPVQTNLQPVQDVIHWFRGVPIPVK